MYFACNVHRQGNLSEMRNISSRHYLSAVQCNSNRWKINTIKQTFGKKITVCVYRLIGCSAEHICALRVRCFTFLQTHTPQMGDLQTYNPQMGALQTHNPQTGALQTYNHEMGVRQTYNPQMGALLRPTVRWDTITVVSRRT